MTGPRHRSKYTWLYLLLGIDLHRTGRHREVAR